mgnify:CR=1 FL=1
MTSSYQRQVKNYASSIEKKTAAFLADLHNYQERISEWANKEYDKEHEELASELDEYAINFEDGLLDVECAINELLEQLRLDFDL